MEGEKALSQTFAGKVALVPGGNRGIDNGQNKLFVFENSGVIVSHTDFISRGCSWHFIAIPVAVRCAPQNPIE